MPDNDFPALADFQVDIPDALKDVIDARDDGLVKNLQLALQEIEQEFGVWYPDPVQKLRGILSNEITDFIRFRLSKSHSRKKASSRTRMPQRELLTLTRILAASTAM